MGQKGFWYKKRQHGVSNKEIFSQGFEINFPFFFLNEIISSEIHKTNSKLLFFVIEIICPIQSFFADFGNIYDTNSLELAIKLLLANKEF